LEKLSFYDRQLNRLKMCSASIKTIAISNPGSRWAARNNLTIFKFYHSKVLIHILENIFLASTQLRHSSLVSTCQTVCVWVIELTLKDNIL